MQIFLKSKFKSLRVTQFLTICMWQATFVWKTSSSFHIAERQRQFNSLIYREYIFQVQKDLQRIHILSAKGWQKKPFNSRFLRKAIRLSERASFPLAALSRAEKPFLRITLQHGQILSLLSAECQPKFRQMNSSQPRASKYK